jgi:hypothetical protein
MSIPFEVESKDIAGLSSLQLTKLLKLLLHLEAHNSGVARADVHVPLNITVADGGEDGRIRWDGGPSRTEYVEHRFVQYQCKADQLTATQYAKEIVDKQGNVKHMVDEALSQGAHYVVFTTQQLVQEDIEERIEKIRQKLRELKKTYSETAIIGILDASKVAGWVNKYIPSIVAVLNWNGRAIVPGLKTWQDWSQYEEYATYPFIADEQRNQAIRDLRTLLGQTRKCARIIGLSGLGKTRLALEILRDDETTNSLGKRVVYIDAGVSQSIADAVTSWIQAGKEGIVVVDNCDVALHERLRKEILRTDSNLSLLTLDYNIEKTSETSFILLQQMKDEYIKQMLQPVYGDKIQDLDRIVKFADGFPQMAVLLAKARLDGDPEMGSLTDDRLASKMLWGGGEPNGGEECILRGCALFDRFGLDNEVSGEYKFIANSVVGVSEDEFYKCIKKFEKRGLIDRRGRYAMLIPKPLAIRLASEWWRVERPEKQKELIESDMPGTLLDSFCNQISMLDFLPEVKALVEMLCGVQGPFGQAEVILSNRGSRLFRALTQVNPEATLNTLTRITDTLTHDDLLKIDGDVRRNIIWSLERLCFHEALFEEAATLLLRLAAAENESWSNNASGMFKQLFRTFASGTEAAPVRRLRVIDVALQSKLSPVRKLAVDALEGALDVHGGMRTVGAEYQGSRAPLVEWRPKLWKDAFDYWEEVLHRLTAVAVSKDECAISAKYAIARNIRGMMLYGRIDMLDTAIKRIVDHDGPLWPEALDSIKSSQEYDSEKMPAEGKRKLQEWIEILQPKDSKNRLALIVSRPPHEHKKGDDGHYIDVAAERAKELAKEWALDTSALIPFIEDLLTGEQRQAYWFGKNLVEAKCIWEPILASVIDQIERLKHPNISFLLGILNGIFHCNKEEWHNIMGNIYRSRQLLKYYPEMLGTGQASTEELNSLIELIVAGQLKARAATVFAYGRYFDYFPTQDVCAFVLKLAAVSKEAAWTAFEILSMYCYGNEVLRARCKSVFKTIVVQLPLNMDGPGQARQHDMFLWGKTLEKMIDDESEEFAKVICQNIIISCNQDMDLGDMWHYVMPLLRKIFRRYGKSVWPLFASAIKNANPLQEYRLNQLLSSESNHEKKEISVLSEVPEDVIHAWCFQEPDIAPEFVARATELYITDDSKSVFSPHVTFLLDNFGDNEKVLASLSANLGTFMWSGSLVPYYKRELAVVEKLVLHKKENVKKWAQRRIEYLRGIITREETSDEESEWG